MRIHPPARRRLVVALAAAALAPALTACGDDDGSTSRDSSPKAPAQTGGDYGYEESGDTSGTEDARAFGLEDNQFRPGALKVKQGKTVVFRNVGQNPHTATAESGADFDSKTIDPGGSFEWKATVAGTVSIVCTIHPGMKGKLTVE